MKKYALDTNVILSDPNACTAFDGSHVVLPFTVLEELDSIKTRGNDVSKDARAAVRKISSIIESATHDEVLNGVDLKKQFSYLKEETKLSVMTVEAAIDLLGENTEKYKSLINSSVPDDKIILVAIANNATLISNDIIVRLKGMSFGLSVEPYRNSTVIEDADVMHTGTHELDFDFWNALEKTNTDLKSQHEGKRLYHYIPKSDVQLLLPANLYEGDYIYDSMDVLFVYHGVADREMEDGSFEDVEYCVFEDIGKTTAMKRKAWDLKPTNLKQAMALNALLDEEVDLVILLGPAGTGKSLISVAAALELTMEQRKYNQIVYTRSQEDLARDTGFLPGSLHEKLAPWMGMVMDSLQYLHKDDHDPQGSIEHIFEKQILSYQSLNFIRGRSYHSTFLICDEYQDLNTQVSRAINTRMAESSKLVALGNIKQLDSKYLTSNSSGLTALVEVMKKYPRCRIVHLEGIQRGSHAEFAEENM